MHNYTTMKFTTILLALILSVSAFAQGNGYLGISMEKYKNEGVRIAHVLEKGAAETYELKQNDIILSINGVAVNTNVELKNQVSNKNWGDEITVVFTRNTRTITKKITLGNRAKEITYRVERTKKNDTFVWGFDKNTWITVLNGTPIKMEKLKEDNSKVEIEITAGMEMPQVFSDLDDKLEIIEAIDKKNAGKKSYPSITMYIRTYTEPKKIDKESSNNLKAKLNVYPNPSLGEFQFTLNTEEVQSKTVVWQVIDITGKLVSEGSIADFEGATKQEMNLTPQGAGVYLLKVVYDKQVFTERLVVN